MVTFEQLRDLKPGDVIYRGSERHVVKRVTDTQIIASFRETGSSVFPLWRGLEHHISKIVPKERTRTRTARQAYEFSYSSGGRNIPNEKNDCTVRALAIALDAPYEWAHKFMADHGRKIGKGADSCNYRHAEYNGHKLVVAAQAYPAQGKGIRMTIGAWFRSGILPERGILRIRKHVFAVVNGVVMDTHQSGPRSIVDVVWEVVKA